MENVEDRFPERNYGSTYGELYKSDSMSFGGGRGNGKDFNIDDFMNREESTEGSEQENMMLDRGNFDSSQMPGGMPQMPGMPPGNSENLLRVVVEVILVFLLTKKLFVLPFVSWDWMNSC